MYTGADRSNNKLKTLIILIAKLGVQPKVIRALFTTLIFLS